MKRLVLFAIVAILLLTVVGCAPTPPAETPNQTGVEQDVESIDAGVDDVGTVSEDLNTSDLDTLDQDLDAIDSLELE